MAEALAQLDDLHARMTALLAYQQTRLLGMEATMAEGNPAIPDQFEAQYAGLDDNREDRAEYGEMDGMASLHERLDVLEHARGQERTHERGGMEY